jgi:hypothetical protein
MLSAPIHMPSHHSQMLRMCIYKLPTCQMMIFHSLLLQKCKLWVGDLIVVYQYVGDFFANNDSLFVDLVKLEVL